MDAILPTLSDDEFDNLYHDSETHCLLPQHCQDLISTHGLEDGEYSDVDGEFENIKEFAYWLLMSEKEPKQSQQQTLPSHDSHH